MGYSGKPVIDTVRFAKERRGFVERTTSSERFVVRRSGPGRGRGLFTRVPFRKGELVIEYTGNKIPTQLADELDTKYLFEIDEDWTIDGSPRTNTARYINHSCKPNCESDIRDGRILIFALRNIERGEELSMDYGDEYFDEFIKPVGCKCDSCGARRHTVPINV